VPRGRKKQVGRNRTAGMHPQVYNRLKVLVEKTWKLTDPSYLQRKYRLQEIQRLIPPSQRPTDGQINGILARYADQAFSPSGVIYGFAVRFPEEYSFSHKDRHRRMHFYMAWFTRGKKRRIAFFFSRCSRTSLPKHAWVLWRRCWPDRYELLYKRLRERTRKHAARIKTILLQPVIDFPQSDPDLMLLGISPRGSLFFGRTSDRYKPSLPEDQYTYKWRNHNQLRQFAGETTWVAVPVQPGFYALFVGGVRAQWRGDVWYESKWGSVAEAEIDERLPLDAILDLARRAIPHEIMHADHARALDIH